MFKNPFKNKSKQVFTKHPALVTDKMSYENGQSNPMSSAYKEYIASVQPIDNAIRILGNIASGAKFQYYKKDSKGKLTKTTVKQFDDLFINDYQSISDFIRLMITTTASYDALYIVGEESKYEFRKGKIDFFILDNNRLEIEPDTTNTIKQFKYKGTTGQERIYKPEEMIYINMNSDVTNILYSLPRLRSLNLYVQSFINANKYFNATTKSGGKKSAIVTGENFLNADDRKEIKRALNTFLSSTDPRVLMLDEDLKVNFANDSTSATELLSTLTYINKTFYEHYQIPKILRGDYSEANTEEVARLTARIFFSTVLKPQFTTIEQHFNRYIRDVLKTKDIVMKMNYEGIDILEDSMNDVVENNLKLHRQGILSVNEVRIDLERDEIESKAASNHYVSAYLNGKEPISLENFDEDIERYSVYQGDIGINNNPNGTGGDLNTPDMSGAT